MNTITAVDGLGQEIFVGDTVIWLSGIGKYGGVRLFTVRGITPKRVAISDKDGAWVQNPEYKPTYAAHEVVVVVNKIVDDSTEVE